jgi:hypothetical protein
VLQQSLTTRDHVVIIFPVLLLCMRVVLETILRNTFSSLFDRPQLSFKCVCSHATFRRAAKRSALTPACRILSEVEAIVDGIFDPDGYHKRLPMLSSSSTGIREAHSQSRDVKHSPRNASLHSKFFTMSPVVHELAAMSQVPQIRVMAAKARGVSKSSVLPARDTISQIVPPALLTQTSRSILCVAVFPPCFWHGAKQTLKVTPLSGIGWQ